MGLARLTELKTALKVNSTPLGTLNYPTLERQVMALASLVEWFDPRVGIQTVGGQLWEWTGRKAGYRLTPASTYTPKIIAGVLSRQLAQFGGATVPLKDPDARGLLPMSGSWSVAGYAIPNGGTASAWHVFGNRGSSSNYLALIRRGTDQKMQLTQNATSLGVTSAAFGAGSPFYFVVSYDSATTRYRLRMNGTEVLNVVSAQAMQESTLQLGASQATPSGGGLSPEYLGDVLVFNTALGETANAAALALVESYFGAAAPDASWG